MLLEPALVLGGVALGVAVPALARRLRKVKLRCAWCSRVMVEATGRGVCGACIRDLEKSGGPAAPEDWPRA